MMLVTAAMTPISQLKKKTVLSKLTCKALLKLSLVIVSEEALIL